MEKHDSTSAQLAQATIENDEAIKLFLTTSLEEGWKVGNLLWKHLSREQQSKLTSWQREAMPQKNPFSQEETAESWHKLPNVEKTPTGNFQEKTAASQHHSSNTRRAPDNRFMETTSILKPPSKLPKQYSGNEATANMVNSLADDDPETKDTIRMMLSRFNNDLRTIPKSGENPPTFS